MRNWAGWKQVESDILFRFLFGKKKTKKKVKVKIKIKPKNKAGPLSVGIQEKNTAADNS